MTVSAGRSATDRLLRPTLPELWTFLAIALPVLAALVASLPSVDLAYQLRAGGEILGGRGIPSIDQWTFTALGQPWFDQQWGAQVGLAAVFDVAGWTGLAFARALLVGLVAGLVLVAVRAQAPTLRPRSAALLSIAAFVVMAPAMALRPQMLGMACFAATLALLARRGTAPRGVWLVPVIAVAWANVHGSFILAPLLVGLVWLEDAVSWGRASVRMLVVAVATTAATIVNPFGIDVWRYAVGLAANREVTAQISEWRPPSLTDPTGALFWASVVLVGVAAVRLSRGSVRAVLPRLVALAAFAALGAVAARGIAWWPAIAAVVLAGLWSRRSSSPDTRAAVMASSPALTVSSPTVAPPDSMAPDRLRRRGSSLNAAVAALLVLVGVALIPLWRPVDAALGAPAGLVTLAPPGVTAALRALATSKDRVWNPQVWGSWLEFAVPDASYALDSRIEVIPASVWADAAVVIAVGSGWSDILDRAEATIVITQAAPSRLATALAGSATWTPAYADIDGTIWIRAGR